MIYADTSVLLAFYRPEAGSKRAQAFFSNLKQPALISSLTEVEFASALARWVRTGEVREADANRIHTAFQADIDGGCYQIMPLAAVHYRQAVVWLLARKSPIRALDALHLACAARHQVAIASFDKLMRAAAIVLGVGVHDF